VKFSAETYDHIMLGRDTSQMQKNSMNIKKKKSTPSAQRRKTTFPKRKVKPVKRGGKNTERELAGILGGLYKGPGLYYSANQRGKGKYDAFVPSVGQVEIKHSIPRKDILGLLMVAYANSTGGQIIIGDTLGNKISSKSIKNVAAKAISAGQISKPPIISTVSVLTLKNKQVLAIDVRSSHTPIHYIDGGVYVKDQLGMGRISETDFKGYREEQKEIEKHPLPPIRPKKKLSQVTMAIDGTKHGEMVFCGKVMKLPPKMYAVMFAFMERIKWGLACRPGHIAAKATIILDKIDELDINVKKKNAIKNERIRKYISEVKHRLGRNVPDVDMAEIIPECENGYSYKIMIPKENISVDNSSVFPR
jgi:hypothetical protein